jgi:hypothetical protein
MNNTTKQRLSWVPIILGGWIFVYLTMTFGQYVETKFFPVINNVIINNSLVEDGKKIKVELEFDKVRNCKYFGIRWFLGHPNRFFEPTHVELLDDYAGNKTRLIGAQQSGPWIVTLKDSKHKWEWEYHFGTVTHDCGSPWGKTVTIMGPFKIPTNK